jgi:large subunit ribosomal protein L3
MSIGLVGRKIGMTRIFTENSESIPVTVVEVLPNLITQIKTLDVDGYYAIQVTTGKKRKIRVTKPEAGHFAKAEVEAGRGLWEFRLTEEGCKAAADLVVGAPIPMSYFTVGQTVDVEGVSKGKGFAGTVKRWNFSTQDATHGNSRSHRVPGSIGQRQTPGRVFPGKKMAGHLGDARTTVQNLEIVRIDEARQVILIRGAIPGAPGGDVIIQPAVKAKRPVLDATA